MSVSFEVSGEIPVSPAEIYSAWLSSDEHAKMTGGSRSVSARVGEAFEAWDGYLRGRNLELESPERILQPDASGATTATDPAVGLDRKAGSPHLG
jgi:hypothetical protein